ncbi:MAG TPA: carbohydrate ABC transporter permease [Deltaproteobacteria bacterium]|nr:carbohydrate ABC transporter permease [Deltaproteobacteria bacterium]
MSRTLKKALNWLVLCVVVLWSVAPFVWQIITSFKPSAELATLPPLLPASPTLDNYISVFSDRPFGRIILNSLVVASLTTVLSILVGSLAAFGLAVLKPRGGYLFLGFVLTVSMFPPISTVSPLYIIIRELGLRDTVLALIITYTTFSLPLTIWILTNFFRSIPRELYLSARVDGCTSFQIFYRIFLPVAAPGLFATAILVFIFAWNEFLFALTFTSTVRARTVPVEIALFPGVHEMPWAEIAAASVIVTVPVVLLVFLFQRRIIEGLTAGAVKR